MTTQDRAKRAAKNVRDLLTQRKIPPVAQTNRPGVVAPTDEEMWDEIEEWLARELQGHIDDAYAAGRADAIREAGGKGA